MTNKNKEEEYPSTDALNEEFEEYRCLRGVKKEILRWRFFGSVSIEDKIFFLKEVSRARAKFWRSAYRKYPNLIKADRVEFIIYKGFTKLND